MPADMEKKNRDISSFIAKVNKVKKNYNIFHKDAHMQIITDINDVFYVMLKSESGRKGKKALVIMNKDIQGTKIMDISLIQDLIKSHSLQSQVFPKKQSLSKYDKHYEPGEVRVII